MSLSLRGFACPRRLCLPSLPADQPFDRLPQAAHVALDKLQRRAARSAAISAGQLVAPARRCRPRSQAPTQGQAGPRANSDGQAGAGRTARAGRGLLGPSYSVGTASQGADPVWRRPIPAVVFDPLVARCRNERAISPAGRDSRLASGCQRLAPQDNRRHIDRRHAFCRRRLHQPLPVGRRSARCAGVAGRAACARPTLAVSSAEGRATRLNA